MDDYRFPLHGDYGRKISKPGIEMAMMLNAHLRAEELHAEALERAIRANIGRADHVARISAEHTQEYVRDADGNVLAAVVREVDGYVIVYRVHQHAEPSFIFA